MYGNKATGTTRNPSACRGFLVVLVERRPRQSSATTVIYLISVMADVCQPIRFLVSSRKINGTSLCGNQAGVYWRKEIFSISVAPVSISDAEDFFSLVHFCNQREAGHGCISYSLVWLEDASGINIGCPHGHKHPVTE